jgi:hypothetical protein
MPKCFVLTGCTDGMGFALLKKLISSYPDSQFITICRNVRKAEIVFKELIYTAKISNGSINSKFSEECFDPD